jgi:hypothetical protein
MLQTIRWRWFAALALMLCSGVFDARAQTTAAIQAAAEKEGALVWYAAMRAEHIALIAAQFRQDFPKF